MSSSSRVLNLPAPKVRNGNVSASAPVPVTRALLIDAELVTDSSLANNRVSTCFVVSPSGEVFVTERELMDLLIKSNDTKEEDESTDSADVTVSEDVSLDSSLASSRVFRNVGRSYGRISYCCTYSLMIPSEDISSAPPFSGAAEESEEIKAATSGVQVSEAKTEDCVESRTTVHFTTKPSAAASKSYAPTDQYTVQLPTSHARVSSNFGHSYKRLSSYDNKCFVVCPSGEVFVTQLIFDNNDTEEEDESTDSADVTGSEDVSLVSSLGSCRVFVGRSYGRNSSYCTYSVIIPSGDISSTPPFSGAAEESGEIKATSSGVQVSEAKTEDCVKSRKTVHFTTRPSAAASKSYAPSDQYTVRLPTSHAR